MIAEFEQMTLDRSAGNTHDGADIAGGLSFLHLRETLQLTLRNLQPSHLDQGSTKDFRVGLILRLHVRPSQLKKAPSL